MGVGMGLKNGELAFSEESPQHPARFSCYSPPVGSEGTMCCLRSTALSLKHRVLPGGTWPRRAAERCNRRALRCPGKRLLSLSHTCVGEGPRVCQSYKGGKIFILCCFWTGNPFCFSGPDAMVLADAPLLCKMARRVDVGLRAAGAPQDS